MSIRRVASVGGAVAALLLVPAAAQAAHQHRKPRVKTLTVFTHRSDAEYGSVNLGPSGFGKGDVYISSSPVRDRRGRVVGTYDLSCTTVHVDARRVRQLCDTATTLRGRGEIVTTGIVPSVHDPSSRYFPPVLPVKRFTMPIIGGTREFRGARGVMRRKIGKSRTSLRFRYMPLSRTGSRPRHRGHGGRAHRRHGGRHRLAG